MSLNPACEPRNLETTEKIEIVKNILRSLTPFNDDEMYRTCDQIISLLGPTDWRRQLVSIAIDYPLSYAVYHILRRDHCLEDTLILTELLSRECVSGSSDRTLKIGLLPDIIFFAADAPPADIPQIRENLLVTETNLLRRIALDTDTATESSLWESELARNDLYDLMRALVLTGDKHAIERLLRQDHPAMTPHFIETLTTLHAQIEAGLVPSRYLTDPSVVCAYQDQDEFLSPEVLRRLGSDHSGGAGTANAGLNRRIQYACDRERCRPEAVLEAVTTFRSTKGLLAALTIDERNSLHTALDRLSISPRSEEKLTLIKCLLSNTFSDGHHSLESILHVNGLKITDLPELVGDEAIIELITVMISSLEKYQFAIATLLTLINVNKLSPEVRDILRPATGSHEFKIKAGHGSWYICSYGEPRLVNAVEDGAVMVVNDHLLIKFVGKMSALCTTTFTTRDGYTFLEGNWYSPADQVTRRSIEEAFINGATTITLSTGEWAHMREAVATAEHSVKELMALARQASTTCQLGDAPKLIRGMSRTRFYRETREYG